jgi:fumarate hydratase class I
VVDGEGFGVKKDCWEENLLELIRRTSVDLPADVEAALRRAQGSEKKGTQGWWAIAEILENVQLARAQNVPLCQDTGTLTFVFGVPPGADTNALMARTRIAISRATRLGYLRQNTVDVLTGGSYATNIAPGSPVIHFRHSARQGYDVRLIMKGAGCENMGRQYSLPFPELGAGCDLEGVRTCILHARWTAQGMACSPATVGVCIGGDRAAGGEHAKNQFLRRLNDHSRVKQLSRLETRIAREAAKLDIGPMGLGGKSAILGAKIDTLSRLPASYFVTVAFMDWAFRRRGVSLGQAGGIKRWLY